MVEIKNHHLIPWNVEVVDPTLFFSLSFSNIGKTKKKIACQQTQTFFAFMGLLCCL